MYVYMYNYYYTLRVHVQIIDHTLLLTHITIQGYGMTCMAKSHTHYLEPHPLIDVTDETIDQVIWGIAVAATFTDRTRKDRESNGNILTSSTNLW